jgi:hypothetical protein
MSIAKTIIQLSLGRIVVILLTICVFADAGLSSPLLFKAVRTIDSAEYVELGSIEASRLTQIRIGVNIASTKKSAVGEEDLAEFQLEVVGVVDSEEVVLKTLSERVASRSFVIETPPANIKFKGKGKGKISLYVWVQ